MSTGLKITSLGELKKKAQGQMTEIPGWDDEPFIARLKRPSLLGLASKGKIPNSMLGSAQKVFSKGVSGDVDIKEVYSIARIIAEESLAEPTVEQIEEAGLELTDEQLMAIISYTQAGAKGLERFRPKQADSEDTESKQDVQGKAE